MIDSDRCDECGFDYSDLTDDSMATADSCPGCGAVGRRLVCISLVDSATVHEYIGMKAKRAGAKKPHIEAQSGKQLSRKTGQWMTKHRVIDRDNDWYEECVVDPASGVVVHECSERLTDHWGHGSARVSEHRSDRPNEASGATESDITK